MATGAHKTADKKRTATKRASDAKLGGNSGAKSRPVKPAKPTAAKPVPGEVKLSRGRAPAKGAKSAPPLDLSLRVPALIEFLKGLEANNNRPWFAWNKPAYDVLRAEFEALVADIAKRTITFDRDVGHIDPKKAMFRIYRDTRFSKDRTPYKTHFSAALNDRAKRGLAPGYYFHIDYQGTLLAGGGIYRPEPAMLARIRRHIAAKPAALTRVLRDAAFNKTYGGISDEDALSRPPKGFNVDTPHIDIIKGRHFFAMIEIDLKKRPPKDLPAALEKYFRDLLPLMKWLRTAAAE